MQRKCVDGAWLPMKVSEKGGWEGLKAKFGDVAALRRKSKERWQREMVSTAFQWSRFLLNFVHFEECQQSVIWMLDTL